MKLIKALLLLLAFSLIQAPMYADSNNCATGEAAIIPDDANPDGFYSYTSPGDRSRLSQYFQAPENARKITTVCVCLSKDAGSTLTSVDIKVGIWSYNTSQSRPNKLLGGYAVTNVNPPTAPNWQYYSIETDFDVEPFQGYATEVDVPQGISLCGDRSLTTDQSFMKGYNAEGAFKDAFMPNGYPEGWNAWANWIWPNYFPKALGIRLILESAPGATGACIPGPETLCLASARFEVRFKWTPDDSIPKSAAKSIKLASSDNSGLFYFNDPNNAETIIKVLDGCLVNGQYWVFNAALTNAGFTLSVKDTVTGEVREYDNDTDTPAQPVQDTTAFPCGR